MRVAVAILLVLLFVVLARALPPAQPRLGEGGFLVAGARAAASLLLMVAAILIGAYVLLLVLTG